MYTEAAAEIMENPVFNSIYEQFDKMADEADQVDEVGSDLESEVDDSGPIEYKLYMCGLTTVKVYKRMTQMKWRLHVS